VLDDANSTAVLINGALGNGVGEVEVDRRTLEGEGTAGSWGATRLEASHDGYSTRYGLIHRRILILRDDGTELRGEDLLVPQGRKGKRGMVGYAIRFHLGPGIDVGLSQDKQGVGWRCPMVPTGSSASVPARSPSRSRSGATGRGARCRCSRS
jgi:uncharacterized heparinase superfamily protein